MGNTYGEGTLTTYVDDDELLDALVRADPRLDPHGDPCDVLVGLLDCEAVEGCGGEFEVTYDGAYGPWVLDGLGKARDAGLRGRISFLATDGRQWGVRLTDRAVAEVDPIVVWPGEPGDDTEVVVLTRGEGRALLGLLTGEHSPDLPDAIARITDAIG